MFLLFFIIKKRKKINKSFLVFRKITSQFHIEKWSSIVSCFQKYLVVLYLENDSLLCINIILLRTSNLFFLYTLKMIGYFVPILSYFVPQSFFFLYLENNWLFCTNIILFCISTFFSFSILILYICTFNLVYLHSH